MASKREQATFSRDEVRELRRELQQAEQRLTLRTARAARNAQGRDPRSTMTPRQRKEYDDMKKGADALERLTRFAEAHQTPESGSKKPDAEEARLQRIHLRTAAEQVAGLIKRVGAGLGGKSANAKARSH